MIKIRDVKNRANVLWILSDTVKVANVTLFSFSILTLLSNFVIKYKIMNIYDKYCFVLLWIINEIII